MWTELCKEFGPKKKWHTSSWIKGTIQDMLMCCSPGHFLVSLCQTVWFTLCNFMSPRPNEVAIRSLWNNWWNTSITTTTTRLPSFFCLYRTQLSSKLFKILWLCSKKERQQTQLEQSWIFLLLLTFPYVCFSASVQIHTKITCSVTSVSRDYRWVPQNHEYLAINTANDSLRANRSRKRKH